jgi:hypothetical protein
MAPADVWACHCLRCEKRAKSDGQAIYVRGHGVSLEAAYNDWKNRDSSF